jgi:hypothetical protein
MSPTTRLLPFALVAALAACSSSNSPNGTGPVDSGGGTDGGATDSGGSGDDSGGSNSVTAAIGPIPVAAGMEETVCIITPLTNAADMWVTDMHSTLAQGSHHLIIYTTTESENLTPTPCMPFQGIAFGVAKPMVIITKDRADWTFPQGVGLLLKAHQMVRVEAHYINVTQSALQGMGTVDIHGMPVAGAPPMQQADSLFWGTMNIDIPPNGTFSTGPQFQAGTASTHLISITTHQHRLGTGIQVWESAQSGDMGTQIADDTDWTNPSWKLLAPQYDFNGTNGLTYQCAWTNTTTQTVTFGESALDEMCFIGGFYYPSQGFQLCLAPQGCQFR